jgi:hypothetical protein
MPLDFNDEKTVFDRAVRVWSWRRPEHGESFEDYRRAFAQYVGFSDLEEAEAIERGAVFTKFDSVISVPRKRN